MLFFAHAGMVELTDTQGLGSCDESRVGSIPTARIWRIGRRTFLSRRSLHLCVRLVGLEPTASGPPALRATNCAIV